MGAHLLHAARRAGLRSPAVLAAAAVASATVAFTWGSRAGADAAATPPRANSLTLVSQGPAWISRASGTTLSLRVDSPLPASRLALLVTLYSHVSARYTFRETLSGDTAGLSALPGGPEIPLDTRGLDWVRGGEITIHLPVSAPDLPGRARGGTAGAVLDVNECAPPNCGGVYPMQVSLLDSNLGRTLTSFTTDLVLTPPSELAHTYPVRFAWVMPLGSSPAISPSQAPVPDKSDVSELNILASALAAAPNAAISLDVFPQFIESLRLGAARKGGASSAAALATLRRLAGPGGRARVIAGTFAPVDLRALISAGLGSYVDQQLARARSVLGAAIPAEDRVYVANTPIASRSLAELENAGITRLLLPNASVQPERPSSTLSTPTAPFLIPRSGVEAMASDAYLEEDLADSAPPALKAQQMLADLALLFFDQPGDPRQGVALLAPLAWHPTAAFVDAVLSGLSESSIVHAVTLSNLFASVTPGFGGSPGERRLRATPPPPAAAPGSAAVTTAQDELAAVNGILPPLRHASSTTAPLSDLVLLSQASGLTPAARTRYLARIAHKLSREASLIVVPFGHTITITSLRAKIPISILSDASVPLRVTLKASSPDLGFPGGHSFPLTLTARTNVVQIQLAARSSGDSPLRLAITAPNGVVLQSGAITIRSTAISGVAIALSFGAIAFLVLWWLRAIVQKRRHKHRLRGAALAASAIPRPDPGDDAADGHLPGEAQRPAGADRPR